MHDSTSETELHHEVVNRHDSRSVQCVRGRRETVGFFLVLNQEGNLFHIVENTEGLL